MADSLTEGDQSSLGGDGGSREEQPGMVSGGPRNPGAKRKWYQASLVEPLLGMALGFLLVVLMAGFLGSPVAAFVRTITGGLIAIGDSVPAESITDGSALFDRYCATCHGEDGDKMPNADLTSRSFIANSNEPLISKVTTEGRGAMPSFGRSRGGPLDDKQVRAVAAYVRSMGTTAASSKLSPSRSETPSAQPQGQVPTVPSSTAVTPQATTVPVNPTATPKPAPGNPSSQLENQPAINEQYLGVVQHVEGWFAKHPSYVKTTGASLCFRCHGATFCVSCHTGRVW